LPWLDEILNAVEHMNFFEGRATEYSKASTRGSWEEAWAPSIGENWTADQSESFNGPLRV
jgi:hypothetical protein